MAAATKDLGGATSTPRPPVPLSPRPLPSPPSVRGGSARVESGGSCPSGSGPTYLRSSPRKMPPSTRTRSGSRHCSAACHPARDGGHGGGARGRRRRPLGRSRGGARGGFTCWARGGAQGGFTCSRLAPSASSAQTLKVRRERSSAGRSSHSRVSSAGEPPSTKLTPLYRCAATPTRRTVSRSSAVASAREIALRSTRGGPREAVHAAVHVRRCTSRFGAARRFPRARSRPIPSQPIHPIPARRSRWARSRCSHASGWRVAGTPAVHRRERPLARVVRLHESLWNGMGWDGVG